MIRQPAVLTILALTTATLALGQPAEAGNGVRLGFGGPLGTFVATPTPGYGGGGGYDAVKPKVHASKSAPVEMAERTKSTDARRVTPIRHTITSNAPKAMPVTASPTQTPGLLGRTLALDSLPRAEVVRVLPPSETLVAKDADAAESATATPAAKPKSSAKIAVADGPATCRKFIPAVGVTVTVACD
jgi:hypothetical protein